MLLNGEKTKFGESTTYDLYHEGVCYAPKAVLGLAAEIMTGVPYYPRDYDGGENSKCFRVLRKLGFEIVLKASAQVRSSVETFKSEYESTETEGEKKFHFTSYFERRKNYRDAALNAHGYICKVCGFDFEKKYGKLGKHFIHVHHIKPVSEIEKPRAIDPVKELIPVCPNCHAMIHRRKNSTLSIEELRSIIQENQTQTTPNESPLKSSNNQVTGKRSMTVTEMFLQGDLYEEKMMEELLQEIREEKQASLKKKLKD